MLAITIRGKPAAQIKTRFAARNENENSRAGDGSGHLRDDVRNYIFRRHPSGGTNADGYCRIEVPAGDMAHRVGHRQYRQAESE